ncbi:MAG: phage major capsid protein [Bauldia litoralis]|uniref:phage major capsid protein n=1 Tax=Bauldia litoralis TaxID=665467 RepID=UPI003297781E
MSDFNEEFKKELFTAVDKSVKDNLEAIVGPQVADSVEKAVAAIRIEKAITGRDITGLSDEDKKSFASDIRSIARGEKAAYLENSDQAGGYLVPTEVHNGILRIAETVGLVPRDARRWAMGSDELEIPRYTGNVMQGEYVGEDDEGDETQNDLGVARLHAKTWMTIFRIGNTLLADSSVSVADWLMAMAAEGLAYRLDREGFIGGTYAGSPFVGILGSDQVATQTFASGLDAFAKFNVAEASEAIGSIATSAVTGGAFYFHRTVWAAIRANKDATSGFYEFGQTQSLPMTGLSKENGLSAVGNILGYPVFTTDVLPALSASAASTKFGVFANLNQALAWGDRGPMQIAKSDSATIGGKNVFRANQTAMRFTHRHAVALQLPAAAVVLKTAA